MEESICRHQRHQQTSVGKFGLDGYPVELHHIMGRSGADFYCYVEMTRAEHIQFHKIHGYEFFSNSTANVNFWALFL